MLILRIAAIGDVVRASTMLAPLRARWPDAHITWVTAQSLVPLVQRFEGVDEVRGLDDTALLRGRGLTRLRGIASALRAIGLGPYDLALVAHVDRRYAQLLRFTRCAERRSMHGEFAPRPGEWIGDEFARFAGGSAGQLAPLRWPDRGTAPARRERVVLLAPGGARNVLRDDHLRRWPAERWAEVARALAAAGCSLRVIGSAADRAEADVVLRAAPGAEDLVGRQSIVQTLTAIAEAAVCVSHDSGPAHLAQLAGTPSVVLFGPTDPAREVSMRAGHVVLSAAAGLACAPCYDGHNYARCDDNRCLKDLPASRVVAAVLARLDGAQKETKSGTTT